MEMIRIKKIVETGIFGLLLGGFLASCTQGSQTDTREPGVHESPTEEVNSKEDTPETNAAGALMNADEV